MSEIAIQIYTGDSRSFDVDLVKDGAAFSPDPETGALICTVK